MLTSLNSHAAKLRAPRLDTAYHASFEAARAASMFMDELDQRGLADVAERFEVTLHGGGDFSLLLGAEDMLRARYQGNEREPHCEQIWAGEFAAPEGGMAFTAFDASGAPLLRRAFTCDVLEPAS